MMKLSTLPSMTASAIMFYCCSRTDGFLLPSSTSSHLILREAFSSRESNEKFQRQLLETRLNLEHNENKESIRSSNSVSSTSSTNSAVWENADGLGTVAVQTQAVDATLAVEMLNGTTIDEYDVKQLLIDVEDEAEKLAQEMLDEECVIDEQTGGPVDALCIDEIERRGFREKLKRTVGNTLQLVRGMPKETDEEEDDTTTLTKTMEQGDILEEGWFSRGQKSSLRRNAEVWKFALKCVFRALKPRSLKKKGASEDEIKKAQIEAATFIRDGLLTLGPTFVKLGQVISTRTDVLPKTYTDVLNTLQDDVPAFSGAKAKEIVSKELGRPTDEIFTDFSPKPLKAASLGQVHTAYYKGEKVAIKVQRAGLKELFDVDLKNLKKLAVLLDKFDPKTDGADRDWVSIYEESERLLYLEIDYLNEADNCERFAKDFRSIDYVRVPRVYRELSTPRVLTMEFVASFKLTDLERIDQLGLDREILAKRTADSFLRQIVETSYFHCDRKFEIC
jgi:hypothetical protein